MNLYIGIIIVILLLVCWQNYWLYNESLKGLWAATPNFCAKSGIDSMYMFINDDKSYILITSKDNITSSVLDMSYYTIPNPLITSTPTFYVSAKIENEDLRTVLADSFYVDLNLHKNKLRAYDSETVYASMKKI